MSRPTGGSCNGGYKQRKDYGRPPKMKADPRTPKPGGQPTQRMLAKRAQDGTRANAKH